MKSQIKKIVSMVVCVCVLLSAVVITATAADTSATISFADKANRTSYSTSEQIWEQNGITVTNNKAGSTSNVADYANPARFYKSSDVIIEYAEPMTQIVITANSGSYATSLGKSLADADAEVTVNASTVTIVPASPATSFTFTCSDGQIRVDSIVVYTGDAQPEPEEPAYDPTGKTPAEIVDAAYELEAGKEFAKATTLTGVIVSVDDAYSTQYSNVTVTIAVDGADPEKPIQCYRLKGDGADVIAVGDTITVTGNIKNYNGTIEFDAGCTLDSYVKAEGGEVTPPAGDGDDTTVFDPTGKTAAEIVNAAYALKAGAAFEKSATLTGVIISVDDAYSTQYENVTVTIAVEGADADKPIKCYRIKGDGADVIAVGDTITVTGIIKNYQHSSGDTEVEFDAGSTLDSYVKAEGGDGDEGGEVTPPTENPTPDETNTLTIEEAIELGAAQADSAYTNEKYYVTGVVTAVTGADYGNMYIADENGTEILIYGTYSADGKIRYDAMEAKPDEGDTVTVYGIVGNFKGTPQLKNAWLIEFTAGELEAPETPDPEADSVLTIEEAIELGLSKRHNTYTENKYYVTGIVKEVYNPQYGNMYIVDEEGNELTIYGSYSADGSITYSQMDEKPVAGDTVKLYGIIGQYSDVAQMKNAWIVDCVSGGGDAPVAPEKAEDILADAEALASGSSLPYEATLTGTVVSIDTEYSEQYGNVTVTIEVEGTNGKTIQCYRLKAAEGEDASILAVGDKITVTGYIINYNGTIQFNTGSTFVTATAEGGNTGDDTTGGNDDNNDNGTIGGNTNTDGDTTDTTSPVTGNHVGSGVAMAIAAAAVIIYTSKKRS